MPVQDSLSKKNNHQMAAVLSRHPQKGSIPVELSEGPVRDVDGPAVTSKDGQQQ